MKSFETTTDLMDQQTAAVQKTSPSRVGGLLMDVGTGKSRTGIELTYRRQKKIDHLVWYCPVTLKETVRQEIIKHTTSRDIYVFDNKTNERNIPKASWYIAGIESMSNSSRVVLTANKIITDRSMVILDESDMIKTHNAIRTERIIHLTKDTKYRLAMTATAISQGIVDLYAQMKFLSPKILGYNSFYSFAANHLEYSEKFPGMIVRAHNVEYIAAKIQPYIYQVLAKECLNLPPKIYESTYYFHMTEEQRYWYEKIKEEYLNIDPDDFNSVIIFRLFTALQEIVCGFYNYKKRGKTETIYFDHHRVDYLMEAVGRINPDEPIIIWAKYINDIHQISKRLQQEYGPESVSIYTGSITPKRRVEEENKFFEGRTKFLLGSLGCGSRGLNKLIVSAHTLFYNNSFKYIQREQAEGRSSRPGQTRTTIYRDIHCIDSIDDRITRAIWNKESVVYAFRREIDRVKDRKIKAKELIKSL